MRECVMTLGQSIVAVLSVLAITAIVLISLNSRDNGIYPVNKNTVLVSGEQITINWDATVDEAMEAIEAWKLLRKR